ncbi:hypothetical protein D3C85_1652620 [compost metagenome]
MRNGVVAMRKQETVAVFPRGIFRFEFECVAVSHGQDIGPSEGLAYVALPLDLAHAQCVAADSIGAARQGG